MTNNTTTTRLSEKTIFCLKQGESQVEIELILHHDEQKFEIVIGGMLDCKPPMNAMRIRGDVKDVGEVELFIKTLQSVVDYIKS